MLSLMYNNWLPVVICGPPGHWNRVTSLRSWSIFSQSLWNHLKSNSSGPTVLPETAFQIFFMWTSYMWWRQASQRRGRFRSFSIKLAQPFWMPVLLAVVSNTKAATSCFSCQSSSISITAFFCEIPVESAMDGMPMIFGLWEEKWSINTKSFLKSFKCYTRLMHR